MRLTNFKNGEFFYFIFYVFFILVRQIFAWTLGGRELKPELVPLLKLTFKSFEGNASHWIVSMGQKQAQTVKGGLINGYGQLYHEVR